MSLFILNTLTTTNVAIKKRDTIRIPAFQILKRVDGIQKEIGLVAQTEGIFDIRENFKLVKDGGIFLELPDILFNPHVFYPFVSGSTAVQAGEYDLKSRSTEVEMLDFAEKKGFYKSFDLSQLYAFCEGSRSGIYQTLNQESTNYFLALNSKIGTLMCVVAFYKESKKDKEGFILNIAKPHSDFLWYQGKLIARYMGLSDPSKLN